jgi:hypothetical protein
LFCPSANSANIIVTFRFGLDYLAFVANRVKCTRRNGKKNAKTAGTGNYINTGD